MRHSTSRSTIYVVIGIGLLILAVSQLRRGDDASNASFVAQSSPLDALNDYQPATGRAEITQDQVENFDALPALQLDVVADQLPKKLPVEVSSGSIEASVDSAVNLVDTPEVAELEAAPFDHVDLPNDLDVEDSEPSLPALDVETAAAKLFDLSVADSVEVQPQPQPQPQAPATIELPSTEMPSFGNLNSSISGNDQKQIINHRLDSPSAKPQSTDLQGIRWKKNPFLTEAMESPAVAAPTADAIAIGTLRSEVDAQIQSEFVDTNEKLSTVANLEPTPEKDVRAILGSFDHETMQSVIAADENLESHSPSIKIGISQADAQKAVHNIEYGKSLSRRGAAYAARQEFYSSLRILAQSHDKQAGGTAYTQALRNGIVAIKEAQDFIVTDTESQIGLRVPSVIETHSTKIISDELAKGMTAIEAAQRYFAYASHQLSRCGGHNVVAAEALYCLGKLHSVQANSGNDSSKLDMAKSMIYHQAAVASDPTNYRSLNELGVLYANSGRFDESKQMLKKSLRIKQLPQAWQNLSVIHQRMGEVQLAQLANREFEMVSTQAPTSDIRWTPTAEFNQNAPLVQRTASQANAVIPNPADANTGRSNLKALGGRILDSIR